MKKTQTQTLENSKPRKEIVYDTDHNKYYLKYEKDRKLYGANLFGNKTPKMMTNIFLSTYKEKVLSHSMDKINFKFDNSSYRPQNTKFEGYAQFARPLVLPFTNVAQPQAKKYLSETIGKFKNNFLTPKNKIIFSTKLNQGLDFYTGTITNIADNKGKNLFLKKINECLNKENKENDCTNKGKSLEESELRALRKIKKKLISNSTNVIFGRKLKKPNKKFIPKFRLNYNIYFRNPIQKIKQQKTEKKDYFKDLYQALNKDEVKEYLSSINPKTTLNNNMFNILKSKKKNYRYLFGTYNSENLTQTKTTKETNVFDDKDNSSSLEQTKCLFENNDSTNKDYLDILNSKRDNIFDSMENNASKNYKHLFSKDYEQKKQFSSFDNKDMVSGDKIDIRTLSIINKNYKLEKKLLKGYIKKKIKEELNLRKEKVKYKPFINIYKKELELLKLVNPTSQKLDEEKEEKRLKALKRKLEKNRELGLGYSPND